MNGTWIAPVLFCLAVGACATKPAISDFQRETDAIFAQARQNTWSHGDFGNWAGVAAADNIRTGKYTDLLLMSQYTVSVGSSPVLECFGIFNSVSCGKPGSSPN